MLHLHRDKKEFSAAGLVVKDFTKIKRISYSGLVPNTGDSGDTKRNKGITNRSNHYLRTALVESSWNVVHAQMLLRDIVMKGE